MNFGEYNMEDILLQYLVASFVQKFHKQMGFSVCIFLKQ